VSKIPSPDISWRADGSPESTTFGDIYFSSEDGLAETRHVFLASNRLPEAWADAGHYTIAETGFGTGLNFLATLALWNETCTVHQKLNFVSVEGFPLAPDDLTRALKQWPELASVAELLISRYPQPSRGTHILSFPNNVTLTLLEDEALPALQGLDATVDAWFLDGFSPSSNPDMWSDALFAEIARLSKEGTRFATFTAAGAVRRGLSAQGFAVEKVSGFGRKRDMLVGKFERGKAMKPSAPWYQRAPQTAHKTIAIIGAGVAGLSTKAALTRIGISASVLDSTGMGSGASGNPAALFMPRMAADASAEGQFHIAAYLHMQRWLEQLPSPDKSKIFRGCGVLQLARTPGDARRFETIAKRDLLPPGHLEFVPASDLEGVAGFETGLPALFFPKGGVITPSALLEYLNAGSVVQPTCIHSIEKKGNQWSLFDPDGALISQADTCILANGPGLATYSQTSWLPLEPVLGQLSNLPNHALPPQAHALVAGHYLISHEDGSALTGATYEVRGAASASPAPTETGHKRNLDALAEAVPAFRGALAALDPASLSGRVALRCQVPDRVPFAGPAPDHAAYLEGYDRLRHGDRFADYPPAPYHSGLYLFGGLGARGFATSLLLGEHLAAQISGAPLPLPNKMAEAVHPARFIIRALRKNVF